MSTPTEGIRISVHAEKRHSTIKRICPLQDLDGHQTICPYHAMKTELCLAALAASMIDKRGCSIGRYKDCAIFLVNIKKGEKHRKCANPDEGYVR